MPGPVLEGEGATDYERYLKIPTLLSAVKPKDQLFHRDEHLFQIVHQTAELWFSQILWDVTEISRRIEEGKTLEAARLVRRGTEIVKILTQQVHVLTTMVAWDYHTIRLALGKGSGQESPGFNGVLQNAPPLEAAFLRLVEKRGTTLYEVVSESEKHFDLLELSDALVDFDMHFHLWRQNHLAFVKRMIGPGQRSLKGYSVEALEKHIVGKFLFPELLAVRDDMTMRAGTSPPGHSTSPSRQHHG